MRASRGDDLDYTKDSDFAHAHAHGDGGDWDEDDGVDVPSTYPPDRMHPPGVSYARGHAYANRVGEGSGWNRGDASPPKNRQRTVGHAAMAGKGLPPRSIYSVQASRSPGMGLGMAI